MNPMAVTWRQFVDSKFCWKYIKIIKANCHFIKIILNQLQWIKSTDSSLFRYASISKKVYRFAMNTVIWKTNKFESVLSPIVLAPLVITACIQSAYGSIRVYTSGKPIQITEYSISTPQYMNWFSIRDWHSQVHTYIAL